MKCSTCRFWSATMVTECELGERRFCLSPRSHDKMALTWTPRSASCERHEPGEPIDKEHMPTKTEPAAA